jgi:hypothetical protein
MKITVIIISITILVPGVSLAFPDKSDKAQCPQNRTTPDAPEKYFGLKNPLEATKKRMKKGEGLFMDKEFYLC